MSMAKVKSEDGAVSRPLILVTNDDGVMAPGIAALAAELETIGDVRVLAPDRNRSGASHAITLLRPLRAHKIRPNWWMVDGTPADCVYLGVHEVLPRRPDLVVSGINAGPNLSFDVHYSGTVGGAMEGTLLGIPSIAVSLTNPRRGGSYELSAAFTREVSVRLLAERNRCINTTLNINVPVGQPKKWQLTFLGHRLFKHEVQRRDDPRGGTYYWIGGEPSKPKSMPGSDCDAIKEGMISVTPLAVDLSATQRVIARFDDWSFSCAEREGSIAPPSDMEDIPVRS